MARKARSPRRENGKSGHPSRSVRISDELWTAASARAEQEDVTMSLFILRCVQNYAAGKLDVPNPLPVVPVRRAEPVSQ